MPDKFKIDDLGVYINKLKMPENDGTNGQFLTTDGEGNLFFSTMTHIEPTEEYTLTLLSTLNVSNQSTMDIMLTGDYERYELRLESVRPATNNTHMRMLTSSNGGSSWASSAYSYSTETRDSTDTFLYGSNSDVHIKFMTSSTSSPNVGSASGQGLDADIIISNPHNTALVTHIRGHGSHIENDDDISYFTFAGNHRARENVNALRLFFNTGNAVDGRIRLYGFGAIA